ncbi:histone H2A deubiquitinase MYSM1-like [Sitophilus oryzae]|uniref:Myb-like, SWIRM and MPN domain-containing protein 1 n=1 Tax=Sitophilus oryzae TaxID=7048 RepID=A0A6J2YE63_SITOR|nr:histone H2A deubiquitinase MYSM1-like [Sitophilus oryzae]
MADEDEIDILGDFTLGAYSSEGGQSILDNAELVSQNSDLLNCDYTIHPQWLLDKPSANPDNWYTTTASVSTDTESNNEQDALGHISTENCITDESGWTEKEKSLLHRGIEIFGKSSVRLSQFVGSKTSSEVKYYLKNYFSENQSLYRHESDNNTAVTELPQEEIGTEVLHSDQIPASIEEVIAVVSTGNVTANPYKKVRKKSSSSSSGASQGATVSFSDIKNSKSPEKRKYLKKVQKFKSSKSQINKKAVKFKVKSKNQQESRLILPKVVENVETKIVRPEITTGKGLSVPVCDGEEIVKIEKVEDDSSDISIDIEDTEETDNAGPNKISIIKPETNEVKENEEKISEHEKDTQNTININEMDEEIAKQLTSLEHPTSEVLLDENVPSELEKVANYEFFEGRTSKTPERYLKIRNHILNNWINSRPKYVYKTAMRFGLKNCGDVTCISRIHYFLEQIGAINFGCEQTKYERPLYRVLQIFAPQKSRSVRKPKALASREISELGPRQRIKKKFTNDGEGGYTMAHGEQGQVINTTIVNEEPAKAKTYLKKPTIRLIYCRPFTVDNPQKFGVKIRLSTLLLMDFHAHTYLTEVMGLVGGSWDSQGKILTISCYEPCKNIASSSTHCDMCPISQARAAESIHNANLDILGWFHSHPTFAPEPSQQDLDTQQMVQQWIGHSKPCIGVILSPFSSNGALISSPFRCLVVGKKPNFEDQLVPFRLKVSVIPDEFNKTEFFNKMKRILHTEEGHLKDKKLDFDKPYFQDLNITHLEKFISSVNMHLAKYKSASAENETDSLLRGMKDVLTQ